ncbi:DeoR faimly transcriptional regulator [Caballeronia mineralivorans PML1(12)]|uniref:DeoR faimly transcriptional regulator n=1 Tax=Caballeronia mineralivorans PML1(12) TaxID=908627 RepID=A0A0J1CQF5_9BURK|nr:CocE/NonD family hydrolase [Caballeronia mineralivorans]KLU22874.1 DeoR faimly transcriptional regulator [Caballeronia mineralivorans PML1(12)]
MAFRQVLSGCVMVCALAAVSASALAEPFPGAQQYAKLDAPAFGTVQPVVDPSLPVVDASLNESVIQIPSGDVTLETTIFKPDGAGPFPMIVFNHGKLPGNAHEQPRARPLAFAREFVRHGYVVVVPNRRGFAESGGEYAGNGCNVEANGFSQARDVAATVAYMEKQPFVDTKHVVVAGASHGGLVTMAYGARDVQEAKGVRGLINFSGGLRQDECPGWQKNLTSAFGEYGEHVKLPSLWMYGSNDSVWEGNLPDEMFASYSAHGAKADMINFGAYKNDAHRLVGDRDGVAIWWPRVKTFLADIGMPTDRQYQVSVPQAPTPTGYASVDTVTAVPFLDERGREGYQNFLHQYSSRAFAVSDSGAWSWAEGGDDPISVALSGCQKQSSDPCRLYAVNNAVVWNDRNVSQTQTASR